MTLSEFLLARVAEDEAAARVARRQEMVAMPHNGAWGKGVIIPNNPARVLAECEAKRRIVELAILPQHQDWKSPWVDALAALAAVYSDHPDYREVWAELL